VTASGNESDFLLPLGQMQKKQVVDNLLQMSPMYSPECPCQYLAMAQPDVCLREEASHLLRRPLAMGAACVYSAMETQQDDGVMAFDLDWWKKNTDRLPAPLTWKNLWDFCLREGVPTSAPAAYRPALN
jgi:hypothetical protein